MFDGFEDRILANTLQAAQHKGVIYFLLRVLHPMGEPFDDMIPVVREDAFHVIEPAAGLARVAPLDRWRSIESEATHVRTSDPSALGDEPIRNDHRQPRCPCHLLDRVVLVEPGAGLYFVLAGQD